MKVEIIDRKQLTPKEGEALLWLAYGKTSWEIGQILGISERTVTAHIVNMGVKLEASNRANIIAKAVCRGILYLH